MKRVVVISLVGLLALACPAAAQVGARLTVGASLAGVRSVAHESGTRRVSTGLAVGGMGELRFGMVSIGGSYLEGDLQSEGSVSSLGFFEGSGSATVHLTPWLAVGTTVRVHRIDEAAPERWLFWGARAAVELPIVGNRVRGRASYAQGLGGTVNLPYGGVSGQSGEVGLTVGIPGRPFLLDLATVVEGNSAGGRSRTLQQLMVTVGWSGL